MSFSIYDASAPVFVASLTDIQSWLDKALAEGKDEAALVGARLAPDMLPFSAQIQIASDTAKFAIARLAGIEGPSMADSETTFAELKARCQKTVDFIESAGRAALDGADQREVVLNMGANGSYTFTGAGYLTGFGLPNFFFHVTTAYAILRSSGVTLGKADFLRHLGPPTPPAA